MQDFEALGVFYLGREYDLTAKKPLDDLLLYNSKDLVTHAVCVGMTGSGKTGLCISLLEEAALDGIPAIVIDPKGDLGNLLLTFPDLSPSDFAPWINQEDARRKGLSPGDYAAQQAAAWKKGLESWGQDGQRIRRLKESAEFSIYTPGSNAGLPISILKSFARPSQSILEDPELLQDRVRTTATSLLGLIGVDADPVQSREHILLSTILTANWKSGKDLDLAELIRQVQTPPVQRVGVIDIESFYPHKDRFALVMSLNNLLAAPGFEMWMQGEALDIDSLLHTPAGKPRIAIFSIAHLSDAERMFFVSLLLSQVLGWTRTQSGTTSLRALLYMDEIFGYFPPTANPPSKTPLLTLLKQARAYGVGVVLATQNPVDLDYKGLANAGTWFIGRLQTERDKNRLLDGLEGAATSAAGSFDRGRMEQVLAGLGNRVFLMHNVNEDGPAIFESRWAMSYLRGPLTRPQIKQLMDARKGPTTAAVSPSAPAPDATAAPESPAAPRPILPQSIPQVFLPIRSRQPQGATLVYHPTVFAAASVFYSDPESRGDMQRETRHLAALPEGAASLDWASAQELDIAPADLESAPASEASFGALPPAASQAKNYDAWGKSLADMIYRTAKVDLFRSTTLGRTSNPGESERDFRVRLQQDAREQRDEAAEKLRAKYAPKLASLQERARKAQAAVQVQAEQASLSKWQTAISLGSTVLGAFIGRRAVGAGTIGRAATTARGVGRSVKESQDVSRAQESVAAIQQQVGDLEAQFKSEMDALSIRFDATAEQLETLAMRPKKTDIKLQTVALAWAPHWRQTTGDIPAWQ